MSIRQDAPLASAARRAPTHGARAALALAFMTAAAAWPAALDAQDCRVRYTAGPTNATTTVDMTAGEVRNFSVNGLSSLVNIGHNDVTSRVAGAFGATADNVLVNTGAGTLVLPPAVWNGQQLQRLTCGTFATVLDAQAFLEWMGGSAQSVVDQAAAAALSGAQQAQAAALALFDPQQGAQWRAHSEAAIAGVQEQWAAYEAAFASLLPATEAQLQTHFPELHLALAMTAAASLALPAATMLQIVANANAVVDALRDLEHRYGASTLVPSFAPDAERDFPEIVALAGMQCPVPGVPIDEMRARLAGLLADTRALDAKYGASNAVLEAFRLSEGASRAFAAAREQPPCTRLAETLASDLAADAAAWTPYLESVQRELAAVLEGRNREVAGLVLDEIVRLGEATHETIRLLMIQEHEAGMTVARQLRDAEEGGQAIDAEATAHANGAEPGQTTQAFLETRIGALAELERQVREDLERIKTLAGAGPAWTDAAGDLLAHANALGDFQRLLTLLREPPPVRVTEAAADAFATCQSDYLRAWIAAGQALRDSIAEYLVLLASAPAADALGEVLAAMAAVRDAAEALYLHSGELRGLRGSLYAGLPALSDALFALGQALALATQDLENAVAIAPAAADVVEAAEAIVVDLPAFAQDVNRMYELRDELNGALAALSEVTTALPSEARRDFASLFGTAAAVADGTAAAQGAYDALAGCVPGVAVAGGEALITLPVRLNAVLALQAAALGAALPDEVRDLLAQALADAEALLAAAQTLAAEREQVETAIAAVHAARDDVAAALLPVPQPELAARIAAAHAASFAATDQVPGYAAAGGALNAARSTYNNSRLAFASALRALAHEAEQEAASLMAAAFDVSLVNHAYEQTTSLWNQWAAANASFPTRAAAFGWGALFGTAEELAPPGVAAGIEGLGTQMAELLACLANWEQVRTTLAAGTLVTAAVGEATLGLLGEAQSVMEQLSALLQPDLTLLASAEAAFQAASALQQRVADAAGGAAQSFGAATAQQQAALTQHRDCVSQRRTAILSSAAQLSAQIPGP